MKTRDLEFLSSYLDGQLSPSDSARLEARLKTDPELASVLNDLRTARGYLRQLPQRRAPRNFTLTRQMVGQNPPMPRAYPWFRLTTALATLMFFLTYGLNVLAPQFARPVAYGMGGGGGGAPDTFSAEAPALQAQAATEAPALEASPATEEAPSVAAAPAPTLQPEATPAEDSARIVETPSEKNGEGAANSASVPEQPPVQTEPQSIPPLVRPVWQFILAGIAILGGALMLLMRQAAARRWK